jgi:hypothetical protein
MLGFFYMPLSKSTDPMCPSIVPNLVLVAKADDQNPLQRSLPLVSGHLLFQLGPPFAGKTKATSDFFKRISDSTESGSRGRQVKMINRKNAQLG